MVLHLPSRGIVVQTKAHEVALYTTSGHLIRRVAASVANPNERLDQPWLVDRFGRKAALQGGVVTFGTAHGQAPEPMPPTNLEAPKGQAKRGHWEAARPASDGKMLLAQWSGECEVPTAYFIDRASHRMTAAGATKSGEPESFALGWLSTRTAAINFPRAACGSGRSPGIYSVSVTGEIILRLITTRRGAMAYMWGSS